MLSEDRVPASSGTTRLNATNGIIVLMALLAVLLFSAAVYWVRPSLGRVLLISSLGALVFLFLVVGIIVLLKNRFALKAASLGFAIAILLCGLTFYANRSGNKLVLNQYAVLAICPPSIASIALDNAGPVGGVVGWFFIAIENAALYALIGTTLHRLWRKS